ncbi:MAG TPA: prepilin peptidase [Rhizomicrobium sp.]|jgi:prepilin peptidase CpaA|nr:prepilin peptidase [Rhizomicrobium sp.]
MVAQSLVVFVLPAMLAAAAGWDLATYTIPNLLSGSLAAAFVAFALAAGLEPSAIGIHVLAGGAGLVVGFLLFAFGVIGGGDAKLFAAVALWLGFRDLLDFAFVTSLLGGGLALVFLAFRRAPIPATLAGQGWLLRLHDGQAGIPYGVALAAGALVVLPQAEIFRLAYA